jgi:hypothetical protein
MTVQPRKPAAFPLKLRIPSWATGATVKVNGKVSNPKPGTFATISRTWKTGDRIDIKLPMAIRVERRFNNSATITRGPLVYSLKIGEDWKKIGGVDPHADYEVLPTTPWNYGLILDTANPAKSITVKMKPMVGTIYSPAGAPIELHVKGRIVPEWKVEHNAAGILPVSPVNSSEPIQDLTLIPYGCAKLRITEFPVLDEKP